MPQLDRKQQLAFSRSSSFRRLQGKMGSATYRLNTIFVGLEHIAAGKGQLPGGFAVTWKAPESSEVAKQVADQARLFACLAATALAYDVVDQYIEDISSEPWITLSESTKQIATKAVTRPSNQGGAYGLHERALAIAKELEVDEPLHIALLEFLAKWRNSTVHGSIRDAKLSDASQKLLQNEVAISEAYSHLNIKLALDNFKSKKTPVPKEITSLIASAQNLLRKLDEAAIKEAFPTTDAVERYCLCIFRGLFVTESGVLTGRLNEYFTRPSDWRRKFLLKTIAPNGVTATGTPTSPAVGDDFFDRLAAEDPKQLLKTLTE